MIADNVRPDTVSYNSTMDGWAVSGNVPKARALLDRMKTRSIDRDVHTYETLARACMSAEKKR